MKKFFFSLIFFSQLKVSFSQRITTPYSIVADTKNMQLPIVKIKATKDKFSDSFSVKHYNASLLNVLPKKVTKKERFVGAESTENVNNVGINTLSPSETLDVNGKTKTSTLQVTTGATLGNVLTSDALGNANWQLPSSGGWGLNGNAVTTTANFIGTTDLQPLNIKVNNNTLIKLGTDYNVSIGNNALASGYVSTAIGPSTIASGSNSTSIGGNSQAIGFNSTAIGNSNQANGNYSLAIGKSLLANGSNSLAIGENNQAIGNYSTALGFTTRSYGTFSTAIGHNCRAESESSTALGEAAFANGVYSTAIGNDVFAASYAETAIGQFNTDYTTFNAYAFNPLDRLLVVGNGTNYLNKSDALVILKNGNTGLGTSTPKGVIDIVSTTDGSLPFPRMTAAQKNAITNLIIGKHIYQIDGNEGVYVYKSSGWQFAY
jgi:hypothetical protein